MAGGAAEIQTAKAAKIAGIIDLIIICDPHPSAKIAPENTLGNDSGKTMT
ncbi:MAG: hypothetical protein AB7S74_00125 [Hyphomicrobium sp.]